MDVIPQGVDVIPVQFQELDVLAGDVDDGELGDGVDHEIALIIRRVKRKFLAQGQFLGVEAGFKVVILQGDVDHLHEVHRLLVADVVRLDVDNLHTRCFYWLYLPYRKNRAKLLPIVVIAPVHRPVRKVFAPILLGKEEVKWLVYNEISVEIHNDLFVLDARRLAPIITVAHSIDIQAFTGKFLHVLNADVVLKDEALDTGIIIGSVIATREFAKPNGDGLKEMLLVIILPEFLQ